MSEIALIALFTLGGSLIAAIIQLVVGKNSNKLTAGTALTDDQREFSAMLLKERTDVLTRLSYVENAFSEYKIQTDIRMRKMQKHMDKMENVLQKHNIPVPADGD